MALRNGDHCAWAAVRAHDHDDGLVRLGRMLWPQLAVRPGEPLEVAAEGELLVAESARITPPYNLTFNLHQRLLERLRDDGTPLYPGNRVLAEIYPGGAAMLVRIDLATPEPSRMGDSTEVELHRADVSVSERLITLADVGGCDQIIRRLRELVELPLLRPAFYRRLGVRPPKGVLLHGPPGTGKTLICKALANELGVTAYRMSATELVGSVQGETEANLRLLFSRALAHAPSLVMIDEFDVIATNRERLASQSDVRAASQLLTLMDGLEEVDGLILMATTNRIQAIDPAFRRPGRFEEEIFVGPPDEEARAEILSIHTREMPLTAAAQDAIAEVANTTGGFTGADLMHLARSAGLEASDRLATGREGFELADSLEGTELAVEPGDFEVALRRVRPSVLRDVVTRTERIGWDQIVGLDDTKARLRELGSRVVASNGGGQGVLLHGPAGSGKSALVHALASELGVNFVAIEGSKVYNQWLGESEEAVRALFRRAAEARPSLVMLDHLDALAPVRAGASGERTDERVVSALLASLDDVLAVGQVLVVGASNRPELIDGAVLRSGRLGVHLEVPNPGKERRGALLASLAAANGLELDSDLVAELAESTAGWSAADIVMLVSESASRAGLADRPMRFDDLVDVPRCRHRAVGRPRATPTTGNGPRDRLPQRGRGPAGAMTYACEAVTGVAGVASGHRLATEAGIEALRAGGSAVDAALAAAFTQWVVNAPQSGPGGEMVALVAESARGSGTGSDSSPVGSGGADRTGSPGGGDGAGCGDGAGGGGAGSGVNVYGGWSRAPLESGRDDASSEVGSRETEVAWPATSGPRNAVVPGSLRGAEAAWKAHGKLDWASLFAGALAAADGHTVTPRMAAVYEQVESRGHTDALQRILGRRSAPRAGTTIRLPELATTLELVASQGPDTFYLGSLADRLVAAASEEGAALSHRDLTVMEASVEPALRFEFDDVVVWVTGAPSQAAITPVLLAAVAPGIDPASRDFAEAVAPLTEQQLTEFCTHGPARPAGTAVATALDRGGLSATVVHSLAGVQFGTGWVAGDTGVAFSNRVGTALSERPDLPGCNPRPGAVLPHTLSAAHVRCRDSHRWMTVATPGGDRQVQWLAQAIQRFRQGATTVDIAGGARWFVCPTGDRFGVPAGIGEPWYAFAEPGIAWHDDTDLAGYEVRTTANVGGGLQVVTGGDEPRGGWPEVAELASDPRSGGAAAVSHSDL